MANLTIRNIPDSILAKLKVLSEINKRSLNNEILLVLEKGVYQLEKDHVQLGMPLNKTIQLKIWKELCGQWQDKKSTKAIIQDIYKSRTLGREFKL